MNEEAWIITSVAQEMRKDLEHTAENVTYIHESDKRMVYVEALGMLARQLCGSTYEQYLAIIADVAEEVLDGELDAYEAAVKIEKLV